MKIPLTLSIICILLAACSMGMEALQDRAIAHDEAKVKLPDGTKYFCQLADTPFERNTGLSKHTSLPPDGGMLFVYPYLSDTSFWMPPEMKFSVDMIFLDKDRKIVHIAHEAPPCKDPTGEDCPSYSPANRVLFVLELNAGEAGKHNLKIGNILDFEFYKNFKFPKY